MQLEQLFPMFADIVRQDDQIDLPKEINKLFLLVAGISNGAKLVHLIFGIMKEKHRSCTTHARRKLKENHEFTSSHVLGGCPNCTYLPIWILLVGILPLFCRLIKELVDLLRSHCVAYPRYLVCSLLVAHVDVVGDVAEHPRVVGPNHRAFHTPNLLCWPQGLSHLSIVWFFSTTSTLCCPSLSLNLPPFILSHLFGIDIFANLWCMTTMVCISSLNCFSTIYAMIQWTYLSPFTPTHFSGRVRLHSSIFMSNVKSRPMKVVTIFYI